MLLRKPALACGSANTLSCSLTNRPACSHPSADQQPSRPRGRRHDEWHRRRYATVQRSSPNDLDDIFRWPVSRNPACPPTPYQIFNQKRGEPYTKDSKKRFYELVKLYHPDVSEAQSGSASTSSVPQCPQAVKLERYRLVVAAHAILSDPIKREAYDRFGHGWAQEIHEFDAKSPFKYGTYHRWRSDGSAAHKGPVDQDPMYNATWEDWERWYTEQIARQRRPSSSRRSAWSRTFFSDGSQQQGNVYMNNYAFISIIFMLAALGGAGQATRANDQARSHLERSQLVSEATGRVLREARENTRGREGGDGAGGETKDSRIRRFLRDAGEYGEGEFDGRALRPGADGLCAPGLTKDRDQKRYWERPPETR